MKNFLTATAFAALSVAVAGEASALEVGHCASAEQTKTVLKFYSDAPASPPLVVQRTTGIVEEAVVSALPAKWASGTSGEHFEKITALLKDIPGNVQYVVPAAGTVTKVIGPITAANDTVEDDRWFDLLTEGVAEPGASGMMIHLFPEELSSIYAVDLPGGKMADGTVREGATRALIFFGKEGTSAVGIYVTLVADGDPKAVAVFNKIRDVIKKLPPVCG